MYILPSQSVELSNSLFRRRDILPTPSVELSNSLLRRRGILPTYSVELSSSLFCLRENYSNLQPAQHHRNRCWRPARCRFFLLFAVEFESILLFVGAR